MDVLEAIDKRRTVRVFKEKATGEQIKKLLLAGVKAPSGGNKQSWEFILVEDRELIDKLAEYKYYMNREFKPAEGQTRDDVEKAARFQQKAFANANVIAVCSNSGMVADGWLAVENILLAATAEGLGSGIIALRGDARTKTEKLLDIPENKELVCVIKIGVTEEEPKPRKLRPEFSWLHKNKYSQS